MAKKKEVYKIKPLNENKKNIISALINEYDIETAEDIQAADLVHPYRLVFEKHGNEIQITNILEIVDYH